MMQALCFFFPSAVLALQHGGIVPHEWLDATARSVEYGQHLKLQLNYQKEDKYWKGFKDRIIQAKAHRFYLSVDLHHHRLVA